MPLSTEVESTFADDRDGGSSTDGEDVFLTINALDPNGFLGIERPSFHVERDCSQREKQISVDPISLTGSMVRQASFALVSAPPENPTLPNPPPKLKFVTANIPSPPSSSPRSAMDEREGQGRQGRLTLEDRFKCGKLCVFLPRGKGKSVRASLSNSISSFTSQISSTRLRTTTTTQSHKTDQKPPSRSTTKTEPPMISKRVSLERFNVGSFSSSVDIEDDDEAEECGGLFFDLPLELIRYSVSEVQSPVTAAFVFEEDEEEEKEPQGALEAELPESDGRESTSEDIICHVRISVSSCPSSPTSVSSRQAGGKDLET